MKNLPRTIVERPKLNGALSCGDFLWDGMRVLYIETIPTFQGFVAYIRVLPPFQQVSITKHPSNRFLVEIMLPHSLRASQIFAVRFSYWQTFWPKLEKSRRLGKDASSYGSQLAQLLGDPDTNVPRPLECLGAHFPGQKTFKKVGLEPPKQQT